MRTLIALATHALFIAALGAATPPDRINYQGVLRDGSGAPSTGSFDMTFHLFDLQAGGNEILVDGHLAANSQAVVVTNGLFNVEIGSGQMLDGSGPGTFTTLGAAFGAQGELWMAIEIAGETLAPRLHLAAAGYALNAGALDGKAAASFLDTGATSQTKSGQINLSGASVPSGQAPLISTGEIGGSFASTGGGSANLGYYSDGIWAQGADAGGVFYSYGGTAVKAYGSFAGGYFQDLDNPSSVYLANGGYGIIAHGQTNGGFFANQGEATYVSLADGANGLKALGRASSAPFATTDGGYFELKDPTGASTLATAHLAGSSANSVGQLHPYGGWFTNLEGSGATLADGFDGVSGHGPWWGGSFHSDNFSGCVFIGSGGIAACGNDTGGTFEDSDNFSVVNVAYGTYKIQGNGSVAFVQNHPTDKDRVIVYNSPEGDEVATYTRGSGRLVGGEARIPLGETFAWVTNPDLGLTAYVTPVGEWADLYVASQSTKELVVRSRNPGATDVTFNYIVYGLRIGFEETSIVQEKRQEAFIPSMAGHRKLYADHPELRRFDALERVKGMRSRMGMEAATDLSASTALRNAIHEYDPRVDTPPATADHRILFRSASGDPLAAMVPRAQAAGGGGDPASPPRSAAVEPSQAAPSATVAVGPPDHRAALSDIPPPDLQSLTNGTVLMTVGEPVEAGDVLVFDPERAGSLRRGDSAADPAVVAIATGPASMASEASGDLRVRVAFSGLVDCKVDAGYGSIRPGDLLTASPTPGHAMRAAEPIPGTILGKAAEALEAGTGLIKVVVTLR